MASAGSDGQSLQPASGKVGEPLLRAVGLEKTYTMGKGPLVLFRDLDLAVYPGEMVAVVGQSGAGKSSLLHLLAALDRPTAGEIWCDGTRVSSLSEAEAATYRNREIGYVWQFHYLLPEFTAQENVAMPLLARDTGRSEAMKQAAKWLGEVGLGERLTHRAGELSGGEQQRASLARALVTRPKLLLADEPTGDLDATTGEAVFDLLARLHHELGLTSVLVTHNLDFAARCTRTLRLRDGRLVEA
jgi:lipoprotein-releasing system ATP-binding protein